MDHSSPRPMSILLIEPHGGLAARLQEMLLNQCQSALDIGLARSLREGMNHLCTHRVDLVLLDLTLPDYKGLDAVRALRITAPACALIVLSSTPNEKLFLDAIRAGAHEVFSVASPSSSELHGTIERALVRAGRRESDAHAAPHLPSPLAPTPARVIHDLNNVITSVNGFADILLARLPLEDPSRSCAEQIRNAGTRAATLVKSLAPQPESSPAISTSDPTITTTTQAA